MISGDGGNVAAYVTSEGVILVDDTYNRNRAAILKQVRALTETIGRMNGLSVDPRSGLPFVPCHGESR